MAQKKELEAEIVTMETLRDLTRAYAEIASSRMLRTRGNVLFARQYLDAINEIFQQVLYSYREQVKKLGQKRGERLTFLAHNGRTVSVLISANTGLYGEIVPRTFDMFMKEVGNEDVEVTIIGKLGRSMLLSADPDMAHTFFEFPDYGVSVEELSKIIRHLVSYERIHVYYGKYRSVITQDPSVMNISAETMLQKASEGEIVDYIFEPSLEKILVFFETEIFASIFEQAIRESQLAKFASRILSMDRAEQNISDELAKINMRRLKQDHEISNKRQINTLSSVMSAVNK